MKGEGPVLLKFANEDVKNVLAIFVPVSFIAFVIMWTFFPPKNIDSQTLGFLNTLLGLHGGWAAMIIGYYFNSSASSAKKDDIIANLPALPPTQPPDTPQRRIIVDEPADKPVEKPEEPKPAEEQKPADGAPKT